MIYQYVMHVWPDKKIIILGTPFLVAKQGKVTGFRFLAGNGIRVHVLDRFGQ